MGWQNDKLSGSDAKKTNEDCVFYKHHRASSQLPINMPMLVSKSHQETNIYNIFAQHVMQQTLQVSLSSITKGLEPKKLDRNMNLKKKI